MSEAFAMLRAKWNRVLTGGPMSDARDSKTAAYLSKIGEVAKAHWTSLRRETGDGLWQELSGTEGSNVITTSYIRIREMALAYAVPGTGLERNSELLQDIRDALRWMYEHRYRDGQQTYSNWWHWQIGAPLVLNDTMVLLFDELSKEEIADYTRAVKHFAPKSVGGNATGANLIWLCLVEAVRAILLEDGEAMCVVRDAVSPVFPYVKSGDGFYRDGSFIQHHHHAYTGSYGRSMLLDLSRLLYLLNGTEWEVVDPEKDNVFRWVVDGFEPVMYKGGLMDMIRGREISRFYSQEHESGHHVIESVMRMAQFAPRELADRFRRLAKHWILSDTHLSIMQYENSPYGMSTMAEKLTLARELLSDSNIRPRQHYRIFAMFAGMDRAVLHRDGFAFAISMFSSRIASYESINGENFRGWYMAHGMTYLYNDDLGQFCDGYWPTVDARRLPGTTVPAVPRPNGFGRHKKSSRHWVGGVGLLDLYGTVGMELEDYRESEEDRPLTAKKSWFLFDEEIVALGSDIQAEQPYPVETIVENRKLNAIGNNAFTVGGVVQPGEPGWEGRLHEVEWMHLAGDAANSNIGLYFPGNPTLHAARETRFGQWRDIGNGEGNNTSPSEVMKRHYLTVWFDHGVQPEGEAYSYVLLPGMAVREVEQYARNPQIEIVEQSSEAHAVRHKVLDIWGVNFWADVPHAVGPIVSNGMAAVMIRVGESELDIAVADPTQQNEGDIQLTISLPAKAVLAADPEIVVEQLGPVVKLSASVRDTMGRTLRLKLQR